MCCRYYWQTINKDAHEFAKLCDRCQIYGGILKRRELSLYPILVIKFLGVMGTDFMGPFVCSHGLKYILVDMDYLSKWVEAISLSNNEG